ncbi:hypothetical protein EDB85DRAFT_1892793 [Lactarius pseudohatsudake]|nr:hypothetical protein EDB85DRAFT_1892793 [Lactarius pseudohatsudake]
MTSYTADQSSRPLLLTSPEPYLTWTLTRIIAVVLPPLLSQVTQSPVNDKNTMSWGVPQCKHRQEFVEARPSIWLAVTAALSRKECDHPTKPRAKQSWRQQREDDQDCGGDVKTIKNHSGDNNEDNQDAHGGGGDNAKTITAAATTAKTIKTAMAMRRQLRTTAVAAVTTTTRRQSRRPRRRRQREDDHSGGNDGEDDQDGDHGNDNDNAKMITAAVTPVMTIKTAAATQRQPQQRRRKDNHGGKGEDNHNGGGWEGNVMGLYSTVIQNPSTPETPSLYLREPVPEPV